VSSSVCHLVATGGRPARPLKWVGMADGLSGAQVVWRKLFCCLNRLFVRRVPASPTVRRQTNAAQVLFSARPQGLASYRPTLGVEDRPDDNNGLLRIGSDQSLPIPWTGTSSAVRRSASGFFSADDDTGTARRPERSTALAP
jgi:hypothetical protein